MAQEQQKTIIFQNHILKFGQLQKKNPLTFILV